MTQQERNDLGVLIGNLAIYYQRQTNREVIKMMVDDLEDLSFAKVFQAFEDYRKNKTNKFFPLPAQIRDLIEPTVSVDSLAKEIAGRIMDATARFGHSNYNSAKEFVGPVGWKVVGRMGGWNFICEQLGVTLSKDVFHAQARELIKAHIELENAGKLDNPEMLNYSAKRDVLEKRAPGLISASSILSTALKPFEQPKKTEPNE